MDKYIPTNFEGGAEQFYYIHLFKSSIIQAFLEVKLNRDKFNHCQPPLHILNHS